MGKKKGIAWLLSFIMILTAIIGGNAVSVKAGTVDVSFKLAVGIAEGTQAPDNYEVSYRVIQEDGGSISGPDYSGSVNKDNQSKNISLTGVDEAYYIEIKVNDAGLGIRLDGNTVDNPNEWRNGRRISVNDIQNKEYNFELYDEGNNNGTGEGGSQQNTGDVKINVKNPTGTSKAYYRVGDSGDFTEINPNPFTLRKSNELSEVNSQTKIYFRVDIDNNQILDEHDQNWWREGSTDNAFNLEELKSGQAYITYDPSKSYEVQIAFDGGSGGGGEGENQPQPPQDPETVRVTMRNNTDNEFLIERYNVDGYSVNNNTVTVEKKDSGNRKLDIQEGYACKITKMTVNGTEYNDLPDPDAFGWISIDVPINSTTDTEGYTELYEIIVTEYVRTTYTIMWANDGANVAGTDFDNDEVKLSNGSAKVVKVYDNATDMNDISNTIEHLDEGCVDPEGRGSIALKEGNVVIFAFTPKYGYQLTSVSANGTKLEPQSEINQYKYIMPKTDIHFNAIFSKTEDVVKSNATKVKSTGNGIALASNELDAGSVQLSVSDVSPSNADEFAAEADGYTVQSIVDINLNQVFYKGKTDDSDVWKNDITQLKADATINLALDIDDMSNDIVLIHEKHDGTFETIDATVSNGTITFKTDSFSNYAIAMKEGSSSGGGTGENGGTTGGGTGGTTGNGNTGNTSQKPDDSNKVVIESKNEIATTVSGAVLKSDMKIQQKEVAKTSDTYKDAIKAIEKKGVKALKEAEYIKVYEIDLLQGNVEIHEVGGTVQVSFNAPSDLKVAKDERVVIYRLNDDGSLTKCNTKFENGKIVFETDHFSTYILAKEKVNTAATNTLKTATKTGDNNKIALWLYVLLAGCFMIVTAAICGVKIFRRR